jgi:putative copper resistance protein D
MEAVTGLAARWLHLAASILLVGGASVLLLAGPSDRPTARRWEAWILTGSAVLVLVALLSALVAVAAQAAVLEGRTAAALEPAAISRFLLQTQGGTVWLVRGGLLLLLGMFLGIRLDIRDATDWRAARGEIVVLGLLALGLVAGAGHAAAVDPGTAAALAADVAHLAAAGFWAGGLLPLALLLRLASREAGADARPYAVLTARRFSQAALAMVVVLLVTGAWNAWLQIGGVPALLGTPHGRLLMAKLAVFVAMLALALLNRGVIPKLAGEAATVGRPAMRRLGQLVSVEAALAMLVVAVVTVMSVTPPARHAEPTWPLSFRYTFDNLAVAPDLRGQVLIGSQVAVLGLVAVAASLLLPWLRLAIALGGTAVVAGGLAVALPPLVSDAYPTTYQRPTTPYHASSIAEGGSLYAEHCAPCHGARGGGDGPRAAALQPRPPDLRAHHVALHTAGDIFWWISHGKPPMPAFGQQLSPDERWNVVNYVRALAAADAARLLGPRVEPERAWLVAPDFTFAVGPTPPRSLKDYRGRKIVLLVLYGLPTSRPRLVQLAENQGLLSTLDVEIVAVPTDAAPDAIARLGAAPPIFFPVVTEGAREIVETYRMFSPSAHAEFLIDRQGYLRALVAGGHEPARDPELLVAEVRQLLGEKTAPPPPDEHVH